MKKMKIALERLFRQLLASGAKVGEIVSLLRRFVRRVLERRRQKPDAAASRPDGRTGNAADRRKRTASLAGAAVKPNPQPTAAAQAETPAHAPENGAEARALSPGSVAAMTAFAREFITTRYDARYNVLDQRAELRRREEGDAPFRPLDNVARNTIVLQLHGEGCNVWNVDVDRILTSYYVRQYHPFTDYFGSLPEWDGKRRVDDLARRVSDDSLWVSTFHRWMLALAEQWGGLRETGSDDGLTGGNQMVPLLLSERQGLRKSTFCRMLVPPALRGYYTDKFDLAGSDRLEISLARFGLVNLDEFDRFSERQMAKLKNLVQLGRMSARRPHAAAFSHLSRIASFIGTSNRKDLLSDTTGSRRFFCQEVTRKIDCSTPVDHAQIFAELMAELRGGARTYFTAEEESAIQRHNETYYRSSTLRELFLQRYAKANGAYAEEDTEKTARADGKPQPEWISAAEIFDDLCRTFGSAARRENTVKLGQQLGLLGIPSKHTRIGTKYYVVRRSGASQVRVESGE